MTCEDKQQAFRGRLTQVQEALKAELAAIATDAEARARQIADDFEADHDLAEGVGATAGTALVIQAKVLLLSGCHDNQESRDGPQNGAFTLAVKTVWAEGGFQGSYRDFHRKIAASSWLRPDQTPSYSIVGAASPAFEAQRPFTL